MDVDASQPRAGVLYIDKVQGPQPACPPRNGRSIMTERDPRFRRTLRALRGGDKTDHAEDAERTERPAPSTDATAGDADVVRVADQAVNSSVDALEEAVSALESKLNSGAGIDGLAAWLRDVEATVTALEDSELDRTRDDIRGVIDRLLGINAEIQNVVRLKKLLS